MNRSFRTQYWVVNIEILENTDPHMEPAVKVTYKPITGADSKALEKLKARITALPDSTTLSQIKLSPAWDEFENTSSLEQRTILKRAFNKMKRKSVSEIRNSSRVRIRRLYGIGPKSLPLLVSLFDLPEY